MSIRVQSHVWEMSPAKGSNLLILLAIADFADDSGVAWPGVDTLARKARLSKRQTQYCLRDLVATGLLSIEENAGPHGTHRYRVLGVQSVHRANPAPVQAATRGGAKSDTKGVQPIAPEPSIQPPVNHHSINTPKPPTKTKSGLTEEQQARFNAWYDAYPRKVDKVKAVKAWASLSPSEELTDQMVAKVQEWAGSESWSDINFVPYPATWLNAERWTDGPPPPPKAKPGALTIHNGGRYGEKPGKDGLTDSERGWRENPGHKGYSADEMMRRAIASEREELDLERLA